MNVVVAVDEPRCAELVAELEDEGAIVLLTLAPREVAQELANAQSPLWDALIGADVLVIPATRGVLTPGVVAACDRSGVRILPLGERQAEVRLARSFGLADPMPAGAAGWQLCEADALAPVGETQEVREGSIIAVWGPHGAPGRTTLAIELAVELARLCDHVALVDGDTHAPAIAGLLGLADEGPGFAAACRQTDRDELDGAELTRLSTPLGGADGVVDVLTGINRVARWPELSERRVQAALAACRTWCDITVVDVSASLEADEEIVSDLAGPRRNAATLAALREADLVVAVCGVDPVAVTRFVRGHSELRSVIGGTPVRTIVNRVRSGPVGLDPRGQVRRTLERFAGIDDVDFVPWDVRASDAATLAGRPVADVAARSALSQAVRGAARRIAVQVLPDGVLDSKRVNAQRSRVGPRSLKRIRDRMAAPARR
ncbi:MAG: hypothetical protein QM607_08285 [Microbacterium sp.]